MRKWLRGMCGVRKTCCGQTTAEYAIIVSLIALCSIALVMMFGDQIRAVFAAGTKRMATDTEVEVEDRSSSADDVVGGSIKEFK